MGVIFSINLTIVLSFLYNNNIISVTVPFFCNKLELGHTLMNRIKRSDLLLHTESYLTGM